MENITIHREIVRQIEQLLDNTALESFANVVTETDTYSQNLDAMLFSLKSLNARYDKNEAIAQVRALMDKYNIQIDELLELYQTHG